jgi:hypothetical protein
MTVEERLEKLEKELTKGKVIRAEKFELVDATGNVRAELGLAGSQAVVLVLENRGTLPLFRGASDE